MFGLGLIALAITSVPYSSKIVKPAFASSEVHKIAICNKSGSTSVDVHETNWDGNNLVGEIEVLDTPKGQILEKLIGRDIKLGISSRGLGSTRRNNEGYDIVEDDFNLVCYDMVSNPSTSGAYMNLKESVEYRTLVSQNRLVLLDEILNDILDL